MSSQGITASFTDEADLQPVEPNKLISSKTLDPSAPGNWESQVYHQKRSASAEDFQFMNLHNQKLVWETVNFNL